MFSTGCRHASSPFPGEKHSQDAPPETVAPGEDGGENPSQLKTAVYTTENGILTVTEPGILPEEAVAKALGSGTDLKITGPLIPENYKLLKGKGITILDLSGVTGLSEGSISVSMDVEGLLNYQDFIPLDFYGDTEIKTVKLPSTAKALPECSFTGCPSLVSVTGSGLEIIGYSAFSGTALETADFPNAKKIGYNAFGGCRKLETLKLPSA